MGLIDDQMADDAAVFVDADISACVETVTYKPHGSDSVSISANIVRHPPEVSDGGNRVWHLTAFVRNHATLGRTSINTAGDAISVASQYGGTAEDHAVAEILSQSPAGWLLLLR